LKLVFDFAGVLFHWRPLRLLQRELPHRAGDEDAARVLAQAIFQGYGGDWADFDRGTVEPGALVARIAARTGLPPEDVRTVVDAVPSELQPQPQTVALLDRLRARGHPLYYLSNMPEPYARHLETAHACVGWFADGVISARVGCIKPEPAIFALAERRFGAAPAELLFIDDIAANVEAARRAGWQALQFVDAAQCAGELQRRGLL
jgi:putative hydrolase of the HAD superfamily